MRRSASVSPPATNVSPPLKPGDMDAGAGAHHDTDLYTDKWHMQLDTARVPDAPDWPKLALIDASRVQREVEIAIEITQVSPTTTTFVPLASLHLSTCLHATCKP